MDAYWRFRQAREQDSQKMVNSLLQALQQRAQLQELARQREEQEQARQDAIKLRGEERVIQDAIAQRGQTASVLQGIMQAFPDADAQTQAQMQEAAQALLPLTQTPITSAQQARKFFQAQQDLGSVFTGTPGSTGPAKVTRSTGDTRRPVGQQGGVGAPQGGLPGTPLGITPRGSVAPTPGAALLPGAAAADARRRAGRQEDLAYVTGRQAQERQRQQELSDEERRRQQGYSDAALQRAMNRLDVLSDTSMSPQQRRAAYQELTRLLEGNEFPEQFSYIQEAAESVQDIRDPLVELGREAQASQFRVQIETESPQIQQARNAAARSGVDLAAAEFNYEQAQVDAERRMEQYARTLEEQDMADEDRQLRLTDRALELFNTQGIVTPGFEEQLVAMKPGIESVEELEERGRETAEMVWDRAKLAQRGAELGIELQEQQLDANDLARRLNLLTLEDKQFGQATTARQFVEAAVESGSLGIPTLNQLVANAEAKRSGEPIPFPALEYVSDRYELSQLQEFRNLANENKIDEGIQRDAARQSARLQMATSRVTAMNTIAQLSPEAASELMESDPILSQFSEAEREHVISQAALNAAIRDSQNPAVQRGMNALGQLSQSLYPQDRIDTQGVDAIAAALDEAGVTNPQIRQGYIDTITQGWRTQHMLNDLKLNPPQATGAAAGGMDLGEWRQQLNAARLQYQASADEIRAQMHDQGCRPVEDWMGQTFDIPQEIKASGAQCNQLMQQFITIRGNIARVNDAQASILGDSVPGLEPVTPQGETNLPGLSGDAVRQTLQNNPGMTPAQLRDELIARGYDPADIDAAIEESGVSQGNPTAPPVPPAPTGIPSQGAARGVRDVPGSVFDLLFGPRTTE